MFSRTARTKCPTGTRSLLAAITFASRAQLPFRNWRLHSGMRLPMSKRRWIAAWTSIPLRPVCLSSSIHTMTFSKKLRNSGQRAASGPGSRKSGLGRKTPGPKCFVFTRRPRAHRSPRNNRTTISSGLRFRRSRQYWAGRSRCTRIQRMKLSRFLQPMRYGLRFAPSKSLLMSLGLPIQLTLPADPMQSRR